MSHLKERPETNCLNCNAHVIGRYCHICGQENIEPKETVWHLLSHFVEDLTHFDGKFFNSLRLLVFRPGFLSREYINGRRASYLNPIRMYVFTSAIFFLFFFTFGTSEHKKNQTKTHSDKIAKGNTPKTVLPQMSDSAADEETEKVKKQLAEEGVDLPKLKIDKVKRDSGIDFFNERYTSKAHYDSLVAGGKIKSNWFKRKLIYRLLEIDEKYKSDSDKFTEVFGEVMLHSLPQMVFISLPFFALLLKLFYVRNKRFYYADHIIFSLHLYIFVFFSMLLLLGFDRLFAQFDRGIPGSIEVVITFGLFIYEYKAIRNFYDQRRMKTIIKFLLLNFSFLFVTMLLSLVFLVFSLFKI